MRAIFLDRDGVINKYPGDKKYVTSLKAFRFLVGAKEAIVKLSKNNFKLFVISNQAGVGKGIYSQKTLDLITERMLRALENSGGKIEKVYYCTHRSEENCSCRKPKAGSIKRILKDYPVNLKRSFFIGDTIRDVNTAKAAGCRSILLLCGAESLTNSKNWQAKPDFVFKDLLAAATFILRQK
jgi:D-glycero-D-manno-heptose 1,7-bisphosphate phosphatase